MFQILYIYILNLTYLNTSHQMKILIPLILSSSPSHNLHPSIRTMSSTRDCPFPFPFLHPIWVGRGTRARFGMVLRHLVRPRIPPYASPGCSWTIPAGPRGSIETTRLRWSIDLEEILSRDRSNHWHLSALSRTGHEKPRKILCYLRLSRLLAVDHGW